MFNIFFGGTKFAKYFKERLFHLLTSRSSLNGLCLPTYSLRSQATALVGDGNL